jgi:hypothetical protein
MPAATIVSDGGSPGAVPSPAARELSPASLSAMPKPGRAGAPSGPSGEPPKPAAGKPADPPKPKTGREQMHEDLRKKAGLEPETPKPADTPPADPAAGDPATPTADPKKPKPNPWKLYEAEKAARAKVEQEFQEHRKNLLPENDRTALTKERDEARKRNAELEDHIRFVDYQKSGEFQEKYSKPLESAWSRAVEELSEISITDPSTNQPRPVTAQDIYELVHLPLDKAREIAKEVFGEFADDVMGHRKEIKGLLKKQQEALEEAKKTGADRQRQEQEKISAAQKAVSDEIKTQFHTYANEALGDKVNSEFFAPKKPVEDVGQLTPEEQEHNDTLAASIKLIDGWKNPEARGITSEERSKRMRLDVAMRLRSIAFPVMKKMIFKMRKENAELRKQVAGYQKSTPAAGGSQPPTNGHQPTSAREQMSQALRKMAK